MNKMNLDLICAECGDAIAKRVEDETIITKAIGVLQEDGVYAFFLYCKAKGGENTHVGNISFGFLKDKRILRDIIGDSDDMLEAVRDAFKDKLDHLLFAKELLERTLVYARYHAKALSKNKQKAKPGGA